MLVPTYFLTLLAFLVASVFSAPIHVAPAGLTTFHPEHKHPSLENPSLMIRGHRDHHPAHLPVSQHHTLDPRSIHYEELEARSLQVTASVLRAKRRDNVPDLERRSLWSKFKKSVSKAAKGVARGVKKATHAVKKTVSRVKHAVKKAAKWVKKNGAKVAKVGLKAVAAASKVASHAVAFIPGIGKPVGQALSRISQTADFVGSKIKVKLGRKWDKVMNVMDKIQHPLGHGTAAKVLDAVLKRDMEEESLVKRSTFDGSELYERDELELDSRAVNDVLERSFDESIQPVARSLRYLKDS